MSRTRSWRALLLVTALAAGVGLLGAACGSGSSDSSATTLAGEDPELSGITRPEPLQVGEVTVPDATTGSEGGDFTMAAAPGELLVAYFGYTSCPDICPVYLNTLARAQASLGGSPGSRAKVLFVGVDTKRDTPKAIRKFLDAFDESFIGLTGSPTAIADAAAELHLPAPTFEEPDAKGNYVVGHPSQVTVFTPDDKAHRIYPYGVRQAAWVHDLPLLAEGRYR